MSTKNLEFAVQRTAVCGVIAVFGNSAKSFKRHTHDEFGIGTIDHGAQVSASGRGAVEAIKGDLITVNPNEVHDGIPIRSERRTWRMLYLAPKLVTDVVSEITGSRKDAAELAFPVLQRTSAKEAFEALYCVATSPSDIALHHWEERLLTLMVELVDGYTPRVANTLPNAILQVRQRIDNDPSDPASLGQLAFEVGISRFELVRTFTRHIGLPPHAYRVQKRVHLARRLILAGQPLSAAAATAGFSDQSHMTRALTRAYGPTPAAFARA